MDRISLSTVPCSFEPVTKSFVEPAETCEHLLIDEFLAGSEVKELMQSDSEKSFVETSCGASADRPRQVMVPDWVPPSPGGSPSSPDYDPEEVEQPTLNGDHRDSTRGGGFYIDDHYGMDVTAPLYQAGNDNIADIFT
ncbi:hypothetical protein CYMTET_22977 [Cymbomonas tetramitiformis]|uniref:Uncharacterized protein n=1 Tax=Cymbomonas tetramitiformis TaxID=36881 RepID=A0AAE0FZ56_9CHLO|nr:hypothetical protein CYMTET_22977 [Cymbomonas tetramitiformis]